MWVYNVESPKMLKYLNTKDAILFVVREMKGKTHFQERKIRFISEFSFKSM